MAVDVRLEMVGLATDPNAHQGGRRGALRRAENVAIDLPGVVRPRHPFDTIVEKLATSYAPRSIRRFKATMFAASYDGAAWRIEREAATLTGNAVPPDGTVSETQWLESRENLYYCSSTGLRGIESASATATRDAGVDFAAIYGVDPAYSGTGPFSGANPSHAYRLVGVKKDGNGYIRRSVPSTRVLVVGGGGTAIGGGDRVFFSGLEAGDKIEAYRTRIVLGVGATPPVDHYLAWVYVLTSTDITNKYFLSPADALADDDLGAACYTNPSREGIVGGKEPPPQARALALFDRCAWFGNTVSKHRLQVDIIDAGGSAGTYRTDTGVQCRHFAGDFTLGLATIANVASVTGLVVGQALADNANASGPTVAGANIPADTKILSITGAGPYTVTMTKNALGTAVGATVRACDVLSVGGVEFYAWSGSNYEINYSGGGNAPRCFVVDDDADFSTRIGITAQYLYRSVTHYGIQNPTTFKIKARVLSDADYTNGQAGQIVFEEVGIGGSSFSIVSTTRPLAFSPQLVTAQSSTNDTRPGRLWWSDPDEPEAVPLLNYVDVGSQVDPIYALTPLTTALLVWKRDGLFRVSGNPPDGWRVDIIDPSLRLLRAECVDVMDGVAYAWTNRGAVAVTETGVQSISGGLIDAELGTLARRIYNDSDARGAFVVCARARRLVLIGTPESGENPDVTDDVYCWSAATNAWSTWALSMRCATYDRVDEQLYYARGDQNWELRADAGPSADGRGYDRSYSISAWTATAGSTTLTLTTVQAGQWIPKAGDWVSFDIGGATYYLRVLDAVLDTDWTLTLESAFPSGSVTKRDAYEGFPTVLEWQAQSAGVPSMGGIWRELHLHLHGVPSVVANIATRIRVGASSDVLATPALVTAAPARPTVLSRPIRAGVARNVARASHLYPRVEINELHWAWRLSGLGLVLEPASERVRR